MISFRQIIDGIGAALADSGYAVYDERIRQKGEGPALYVSIASASEQQAGPMYFDRRIRAGVTCADGDDISNARFYEFVGRMNACLRQPLWLGDRCIMPKDFEYKVDGGMGKYEFTICFLDDGVEGLEAQREEMEELIVKEEI